MRQLRLSDCNEQYLAWLQDPQVTEFLDLNPKMLNILELQRYVITSFESRKRINFAAELDGLHIGNASLYRDESDELNVFRTGWFIGDKRYWGSHTSTQIMFILFDIGFSQLNFNFCYGSVRKSHVKARISNKFIGFSEIFCRTEFSKRLNKIVDVVDLRIDSMAWSKRRQYLISTFPEKYNSLDYQLIDVDWCHYKHLLG